MKVDGYRAIAFKRNGALHLRSPNDNDFNLRYPDVMQGLAKLPDETVIDGEVVAFDSEGKPSFNALQNYGSAPRPVVCYVFDVMMLAGKSVMSEPLEARMALLENKVLPKLNEPVAADIETIEHAIRGVRRYWLQRDAREAAPARMRVSRADTADAGLR